MANMLYLRAAVKSARQKNALGGQNMLEIEELEALLD